MPLTDVERARFIEWLRHANRARADAWLAAYRALTQEQQDARQVMPQSAKDASKNLTAAQLTDVMKRATALAA